MNKSKISKALRSRLPEGAYGAYIKLSSSVGVKVYHYYYPTLNKANKSSSMRMARKAMKGMALAKNSGIVPKPIGVKVLKLNGSYRVCLIMRHIDGGRSRLDYDSPKLMAIDEKLRECGVIHRDLGGHNVVWCKKEKKHYAVDFDFVDFSRKRNK